MATARDITAAFRTLVPSPVRLSTRTSGGDWLVFMPTPAARNICAATETGRDWLTRYLNRRLGQPVHVVSARDGRRTSLGQTTLITVRPGECPGPSCPPGR
jgi:hypothetical protein